MSNTSPHFRALDGWRGLCALLVAAYHFPGTGFIENSAIIRNASYFVDFFFVLSGFVIAANYLNRLPDSKSAARFMGLRLGRLYPLHLFTFLAFFAFEFAQAAASGFRAGFNGMSVLEAVPTNLLLIQSWGMHDQLTWNFPAWSISCEIAAYAAFALITVFSGRARWWVYAGMVFVPLALLWRLSDGYYLSTYDYGVLRCFAGFFAGVFAWKVWSILSARMQNLSRAEFTVLEIIAATAAFGFVASIESIPDYAFATPFVFAFAVVVFSFDGGVLSRLLQTPLFQKLGLLSYSIYMVHAFLLTRFANVMRVFHDEIGVTKGVNALNGETFLIHYLPGDVLMIVFMAVLIGVSALTYRYIEVPGRDLVRGWIDRQEQVRASTPAR